MTPEEIEDLKKEYVNHLKEYITQTGSLFAHLVVIGTSKEDNKKSIIHVPIPPNFIKDEKGKDTFVKQVLPEAAKEIVKKFNCELVGWASEAWLRVVGKDEEEKLESWKDIPIKKEVVFIMFENKEKQETIVYDIIRNGKQVNSEGDLADSVDLVKDDELSKFYTGKDISVGRLSGLYKAFEQPVESEGKEADLSY